MLDQVFWALPDGTLWLSHYENFWRERFDALGRYLQQEDTQSRSKNSGVRGPTRKR